MTNLLFSLQNLSYSYDGSTLALDSISLEIKTGEKVVLLGSNGCGKSTLLKILDGLYFPTSGTLTYFGKCLREETFHNETFNTMFRTKLGLVFQDSDIQLFLPTVEDELAFAPLQLDISVQEVQARVEAALQALHIEALRERAPHQLSSGEKKKVALASLLTLEPEVWLMDEPTAGLDPRTESWLIDFIQLQGDAKKTILLATHDLELVKIIADRAFVLDEHHRLIAQGSPDEILANHDLLVRANLIW